jgi:hypothetical protein
MNNLLDNNKSKVISELLDVISKGVELLATEYLDKGLYDSFERYATSTLKVVDVTFATNYVSYISSSNSLWNHNCGMGGLFNSYSNMHYPNSAASINRMKQMEQETKEYKIKLKYILQQLVTIVKGIMYI